MYYAYLRVRNSPAGRAKPIRIKGTNDGSSWDVNNYINQMRMDAAEFFREYKLPFFSEYWTIYKGVYKNYKISYIQAYLKEGAEIFPPNAFKSREENLKYLMKYYWSYKVEQEFFAYLDRANSNIIRDNNISDQYKNVFNNLNLRMYTLAKAGIIDCEEEYKKYKTTGKSDLHTRICENFDSWMKDHSYFDNAINKNKSASSINLFNKLMGSTFSLFSGLIGQYLT